MAIKIPKSTKLPKSPSVGSKPSSFSAGNNGQKKQEFDYARQLRDIRKNINQQQQPISFSSDDEIDDTEDDSGSNGTQSSNNNSNQILNRNNTKSNPLQNGNNGLKNNFSLGNPNSTTNTSSNSKPSSIGGLQSKSVPKQAPKGIKGIRGLNVVQDAKDVSRGLESTGSALSGDYKKMDRSSKKQADMDTAQGIKAAAGYTGVGKPIVMAIDAAEQIPVAGRLVKFAERKIGQNVNKKLGSMNKIPGVGNAIGGAAKSLGGAGSQMLGEGKAAYNQKQKDDIKAGAMGVGMMNNPLPGNDVQQNGPKSVSQGDEARIARDFNKTKQKQQMEEQKEMAKNAAKQAAKQAASKAVKKGASQLGKIVLRFLVALLVNPITWLVILAFCLVAMIVGAFMPGDNGQKPPLTPDQQSAMCSQYQGSAGNVGVDCKKK